MLEHKDITDKIIGSFYDVYNELGFGFLEKVYENSMFIQLRSKGLFVQKQQPVEVFFKDQKVGQYFADLVVDEKVIVELKAAEGLREEHEAQLINYLKATNIEVGLLLNFGVKPQFKRVVHFNKKQEKNPDKTS